MLARRLLFFSAIVVTISLFQNCDNSFTTVKMRNSYFGSTTGDVCLDSLKVAYATTYHPFLKNNCGACHNDKHGSSQIDTSFASFMTYGPTLIDHQSTTAHGGNTLGPQMQPEIDALKPTWTQASDNYVTCKASQGVEEGSSIIDVPLAPKVIPNLANTAANANTYVPFSFNTATEVASNNQMNVIQGTLRIEVRLWTGGGTFGLLFRNPTFAPANGSTPFVISGLSATIDNMDQGQFFTTYKTLGTIGTGIAIPSGSAGTAAIALAPQYGAAPLPYAAITATTPVGLVIKNAILNGVVAPPPVPTPPPTGTPPPAVVTYAQLTAGNGVFTLNCVGCHSAAAPAGGLNLTDYAQAFAARNTIAARINNTAMPMPPSGVMPVNQILTIENWVNNNAPQN